MDSLNRILRSNSSGVLKNKQQFMKSLQAIVKQSVTPSSRRELLKNIYIPRTTKAKSTGKSYELQLSASNLFKTVDTPKKRSISKNLSKPGFEGCSSFGSKPLSNSKKSASPKKPLRLLKNSPKNVVKKKIPKKISNLAKPFPLNNIFSLSFRTRTGSVNGKQKPHNQDEFFVIQDYGKSKNQVLIGVMDGHGIYGQEVSSFIKKHLPLQLELNMPFENLLKNSELIQENRVKLENSIIAGFKATQRSLLKSGIDVTYSGTTAITLLLTENTCICSNIGDSRAVIGRYTEAWHPVELSYDHKPSNLNEKIRIEMAGGRIEPFRDKNGGFLGPDRVWLSHQQLPGLAMSRSFGDLLAASVGVSCEPEIIVHNIQPSDKFIVIASDGVWEFISNNECVQLISEFFMTKNIEQACDALMKKAVDYWTFEDNIVDDITFVIVFFNS